MESQSLQDGGSGLQLCRVLANAAGSFRFSAFAAGDDVEVEWLVLTKVRTLGFLAN